MGTSERRAGARRALVRTATGGLLLTLLAPAGVRAQAVDEPSVSVSAHGQVEREPDRAEIRVAVETFAETANEAAHENAALTERVLDALRRLDIPRERIRTVGYRIDPRYEHDQGRPRGEPRLAGYQARNMVLVTVDDVGRVGAVVDAAVAAGANRIDGLDFGLRDPDEARRAALADAVARARAEAETIAAALGRALGPALHVSTGGPPRPFRRARGVAEFAARSDAAVPTPVEPGLLDVTADVTIVFRLEPR